MVVGVSLSEPHTSVTALQDACVCMLVCLRVAIYRKFKLNNCMQRYNVHFKFACVPSSSKFITCWGYLSTVRVEGSEDDSSLSVFAACSVTYFQLSLCYECQQSPTCGLLLIKHSLMQACS